MSYTFEIKSNREEIKMKPIVHEFKGEEETIGAENVAFCLYPPLQRAVVGGGSQEPAIIFTVTWPRRGGRIHMPRQGNYVVTLPAAPGGVVNFDLIVEGGELPANLGRIGLRPWARGKSDPNVQVIWAIEDSEL